MVCRFSLGMFNSVVGLLLICGFGIWLVVLFDFFACCGCVDGFGF